MMSEFITNEGEKQFAQKLESQKLAYIYQPKYCYLASINYTPDFYVFRGEMFYEIIGSRQAFNQNREKILEAKQLINLLIVKPDGEDYNYQDIRKDESITRIRIKDRANHRKILNDTKWSAFNWMGFMNVYNLDISDVQNVLNATYPTAYDCIKRGRIRKANIKFLVQRGFRNYNQFIQLSQKR